MSQEKSTKDESINKLSNPEGGKDDDKSIKKDENSKNPKGEKIQNIKMENVNENNYKSLSNQPKEEPLGSEETIEMNDNTIISEDVQVIGDNLPTEEISEVDTEYINVESSKDV